MGRFDNQEPSAWRIAFRVNCTTPVLFVAVTTVKALVLSLKSSSMESMRLTRVAAAAVMMA